MEASLLADIKKYYGSEMQTYCSDENILLYKAKCGGIRIKSLSDLMVCSNLMKIKYTNKECRKTKNIRLRRDIIGKKNEVSSISLKKKKNANDNAYLNLVRTKVIMHDTSSKISAKCPSGKCILDKAISGTMIYKLIMKTKVRPFEIENNGDINSTRELISILELFQEKHRVHNYKGSLMSIIYKNSLAKCCKASRKKIQRPWHNLEKYEITAQQLSTYFTQILIYVVPIELFGCFQNREIFTKLVCRVLRSARFQPIYLKPYIRKLNIKKMVWLQSFEDESVQWLITIKLIKWLLLEYIIKILYKYIHVTVHPSAVGKRLYFAHYLWHRMINSFIQENIKSEVFLPMAKTNSVYWCPSTCEYKLFMKNSGFRPIVKVCSKEEIPEMKKLLKFLRQLYVTHYGPASRLEFFEKWKTIVHEKSTSECSKMWLVSCDLDNAYGSILLDQLNRIIRILCNDLPEKLKYKWIACLPYRHKDSEIIYSQYFSDLQVVVPVGTMYTSVVPMNGRCKCYFSKKALLLFLEMCIFRQNVQVRKKNYLIGKGILQGTMLSNILFDIYYGYISHKYLSTFLRSGIIFRYVDDILYVTENMESAIKFINKIKKGFTKYNCKFKLSKLQINFSYENNNVKNEIAYLGWKINCDTLEILPSYSDAHPSHMFTVAIKNRRKNDSLTLLKDKLYNQSYLRLSYIILRDPKNFVKNLITLVKKVAVMHAWRTLMFIRKLFNDVHGYETTIFEVIKKSNKNLSTAFLKLYTYDKQENLRIDREEMKYKIVTTLWNVCRRVFLTDSTFNDEFGDLLTNQIRNMKNHDGTCLK